MNPSQPAAIVELRDLELRRGAAFALRVPRLRVGPGEVVALQGPSGSGKSSLLAAVLGLDGGDASLRVSGERRVLGESRPDQNREDWRRRLREQIGYVPQDATAALDPLRRIGAQVAELGGGATRAEVIEALGRLGIEQPEAVVRRAPHQVSGGQAQRVLLAIALLRRPALLVMDEPTAGLDRARIEELSTAIDTLRRQRPDMALLVAAHGRVLIDALGARVHHLVDGELRDGAAASLDWPEFCGLVSGEGASGERASAEVGAELLAACRGIGLRRDGQAILEEIELALRRGESVALLGPSGAGKTSLGRLLAGHLYPDQGLLQLPERPRAVQMLFQDAGGSLTPHRSAISLCREVLDGRDPPADLCAAFGLNPETMGRPSASLSGGQQRRVALLRALCAEPELLVLDEPSSGLDRQTAIAALRVTVQWLRARGAGSLWITHDDELAAAVADRVLRIEGGRLC